MPRETNVVASPEIRTLTGLRGVAALWVTAFHFTLPWTGYDNWAMPLARYGNYGVSVFFVLSGFILSYVYKRWFSETVTAASYRLFMRHRFARIYPLHALTLLLTALLMWRGLMTPGPFDNPITFILNVFLLHGWGYPDTVTWNAPSWTISVEMFAYLLFPFIMALICRLPTVVVALLGLAACFGDGAYIRLLQTHGLDVFHSQFSYGIYLIRYLLMFVIGMVTFHLADRIGRRIKPDWVFDVIAAIGLAWIIGRGAYQKHTLEIIYGSAVLIFGLSRDTGLSRVVMGNRAVVLLGEWSYALYLSHIIVFSVMWDIAARLGHPFPGLPLLLTTTIAIAAAALLHYAFERPARRLLRSGFRFRRTADQAAS